MLRRAAATGLPQVRAGGDPVGIDQSRLVEELLAILGHGVGGAEDLPELEPAALRELRDRVRARLREAGVDPDSGHAL